MHAQPIRRRLKTPFRKAIWLPTPGVLKSLDHAGLPQSKQNISQFEPAEAVF